MTLPLSVVIPSATRADLLRRCLRSVRAYAPAGTEILVVDDASPGGAASAVAAELGVGRLRLARRRGFCVAANRGIGQTRGAVVELLNDDTEVTAGWADAALAAFLEPNVGAVAPLVLRQPDRTEKFPHIDSAGDRYYLGGVAGKRGHNVRLGREYLAPCRVFGASASSAFYRRDALRRVGAFPESFGAYFEDVDLSFRLQRAGYQVRYEPTSRVYHRVSASHRASRRLLEQQSRNEERVFWRNIPTRALARALPRHLGVLAGKAWRRWQEGRLTPFLCGRLRVLGELPDLLRHRRQLQALGPEADMTAWSVETRFWVDGRP